MLVLAASIGSGTVFLAASGAKLGDRVGSLTGLETYGIRGRVAPLTLVMLVALEAMVGAGLVAGNRTSAVAGAALLALFAAAQAVVLAAGRAGAPCGCLGGRGRVSRGSATIVAGAAAVLAVVAERGPEGLGHPATAAFAVVVVAASALLALARRPRGALDVAGEGPAVGDPATFAPQDGRGRLVLFVSEGCRLCRGLLRRAPEVAAAAGLDLLVLDEEADGQAWLQANVPGSPYAVVVDPAGTVSSKGTVNHATQLRSLLPVPGDSRRAFLERAAGAAAAAAVAPSVGALVKPGEAEAYHFCGHIYTTDSCPHPTGVPRIDSRGYPLRASDGHRVDDLGRLIDSDGDPIDDDGNPLLDPDGRALPQATRTKVCAATGREYGLRLRVDGSWYRCCNGRVRKLIDCCTTGSRRINGDRALTGYCYRGRKVFCVMYYQTRVPC